MCPGLRIRSDAARIIICGAGDEFQALARVAIGFVWFVGQPPEELPYEFVLPRVLYFQSLLRGPCLPNSGSLIGARTLDIMRNALARSAGRTLNSSYFPDTG